MGMKQVPANRKLGVSSPHNGFVPRVFVREPGRKKAGRLLVKCGCCDEKVEIHYGEGDNLIEINGVCASAAEWRKILDPLLNR